MTDPGQWMAREMAEQPDVLARLVTRWEDDVARVAALLADVPVGVAFAARGSSDNAAQLGRYAVEVWGGVPGLLMAPSLLTRYDSHPRYSGYLVVALSQSGETPEIVTVAEAARVAGAVTVAVTNGPGSPLSTAADLTLPLEAGRELAVPATKTVTSSMLAVLTIAAAVARRAGRPEPIPPSALTALPGAVDRVLADPEPVQELAARWAGRERLQVAGRGLAYGAVLETALKVRETSGVFAQGLSVADLLHGPVAALDPQVPVVLVDPGGPGAGDVHAVESRLTAAGSDTSRWAADTAVGLPGGLPEPLATITATVRGQQLARAWALAVGHDPDRPAGLSKVTVTR